MKRLGIGVRVRKVNQDKNCPGRVLIPIGTQGRIVGVTGNIWLVEYPGFVPLSNYDGGYFIATSSMLEPFLSPGTDEWAREKVKKFTKPEPVSPALPTKERVLK